MFYQINHAITYAFICSWFSLFYTALLSEKSLTTRCRNAVPFVALCACAWAGTWLTFEFARTHLQYKLCLWQWIMFYYFLHITLTKKNQKYINENLLCYLVSFADCKIDQTSLMVSFMPQRLFPDINVYANDKNDRRWVYSCEAIKTKRKTTVQWKSDGLIWRKIVFVAILSTDLSNLFANE